MSTEYHFADPKRKEATEHLMQLLAAEKEILINKLHQFSATHPLVADLAEGSADIVNRNFLMWSVDDDNDSYIIGVSTRSQFHWRHDNGFQSFDDVAQFLAVHPNLVIEDEYGKKISLEDFKKIAA